MQFEGVQTAVDEAGSTPDALATPDPVRRDSRNQAEARTDEPGRSMYWPVVLRTAAARTPPGGAVGADQAVGGGAGDREVRGRGLQRCHTRKDAAPRIHARN
jgi:hypothetical protein